MTPDLSDSAGEAAARVCEQLAKTEAKKANENRGKRKAWLIRRRAFLDAAAAIRATRPKGSSMTTLSQALAVLIGRLMPTSDPEVTDAIRRLTATSTPPVDPGPNPNPDPQEPEEPTDPVEPNEPPEDNNNPPEPPDWEDPNDPDNEEPTGPEEPQPEEPEEPTTPPPGPVTGKAPGEVHDLTYWKLNLPVQLNGAKTGYSPTINIGKNPDLRTFILKDIWELTSDGQVLVTCPLDGVTTSSSTKYARTELRGTFPPGKPTPRDTPYNMDFLPSKGTFTLGSEFAVLQFGKLEESGKDGRVCIGQIHGPDDELCRFYVDPSMASHPAVFYYVNDKSTANGLSTREQIIPLLDSSGKPCTSYTTGEYVKRAITVENSVMTVTAIYKGKTYTAVEPLSNFWKGASAWCYFKDGVYGAQHSRPVEGGVRGSGVVKAVFRRIGVVNYSAPESAFRTA